MSEIEPVPSGLALRIAAIGRRVGPRCLLPGASAGALLLTGSLLLPGVIGCEGPTLLPPGFGDRTVIEEETPENFDLAWDVFDQLITFNLVSAAPKQEQPTPVVNPDEQPKELVYRHAIDLPQAVDRVMFHLNNWIIDVGLIQEFEPDGMVNSLPQHLKDSESVKRLGQIRFDDADFFYLQQCLWARQIGLWAAASEPGPLTTATIAQAQEAIEAQEQREQLATAVKLFDWTIRNVQLDPLLPAPSDIVAGPGGQESVAASQRGIAGPGYTAYPWQVMLMGHGDAWQRASVFLVLVRQAGIPAVMLAAEDAGPAAKHQPLLPAVLIGGKLYLFDTALGLPLPGPGGKGIATLDDLLDKPDVLRSLDIDEAGETLRYPIGGDQLAALVALIYAEPQALSRRMRVSERRLSGHRKAVLTTSPEKLAGQLTNCRGIKLIRLWRVPFETVEYQNKRPEAARKDPQRAAQLLYETQVFGSMTPTCTGRYTHLHGRFDQEGDAPGAVKWYLDARAPDEDIDRLEYSQIARERIGLVQGDEETDEQFKQRVSALAKFLRQVKREVTLWLAQVQYETRAFGAAENWLTKIEIPADDPGYAHVQYNLARAYEAFDKIDEARRIYLLDESPQKLGNRLRANMLRELQAGAPG
jgi:hypothetical protein